MAQLTNVNISINASGDNTVVSATAGKTIKVRRLALVNSVATAQSVQAKDGASTVLGTFPLPSSVGGGIVLGDGGDTNAAWFVTTQGNAFILNLSAATTVNGYLQYSLE